MFSPVQVAAWGGYTFVLNLIGLHAAVTAVRTIDLGYDGTLSFADPTGLHRAYSIFYIIGTRHCLLLRLFILLEVATLLVRVPRNGGGCAVPCRGVGSASIARAARAHGNFLRHSTPPGVSHVAPVPAQGHDCSAVGVSRQAHRWCSSCGCLRHLGRLDGWVPWPALSKGAGALCEAHQDWQPARRLRGRTPVYAAFNVRFIL